MSAYGEGSFNGLEPAAVQTTAPLVFFGNERIATSVETTTPVITSLIEAGYNIVAIVSSYERGKSRNVRDLEIAEIAKEHNIPLLLPEKPKDIAEQLRSYNAAAGILVAYGKIIPQSVIDIFPKGIINIHPSLLPRHRGPTPLESVVLDGSKLTGVSVMSLAKEMDAGPIYAQSEIELEGTESKQDLADVLLEIGSEMLLEVLPGILRGSIVALPQDSGAATYDKLIAKTDGNLDPAKPAVELEREIRAYLKWPKSRMTLAGKEVVITKAHVLEATEPDHEPGQAFVSGKELHIQTSDGVLVVDTLKPAGKAEMPAPAFLAGYSKNL